MNAQTKICLLLCWLCLSLSSLPLDAQTQYAGQYIGQQFNIELQANQQGLVGKVSGASGTFQLQAKVVGQNAISGSYNYYGQQIPFTGQFEQNRLVITSEGQQYVLNKQNAGKAQSTDEIADPNLTSEETWGIAYALPSGWRSQTAEGVTYIFSPDQKKLMVLMPDNESISLEDLKEGAKQGIEEGNTKLTPKSEPADFGSDGVSVLLTGTFNGLQANGMGIGRLSPYKSGAIVIGVAEAKDYDSAFESEIQTFAKSIQFFKPKKATDDNGNVADWSLYMKGRKLSYYKTETGFTMEVNIYLCSDGSFKYTDNSSSFGGGASVVGTAGYTGMWQAYGQGNTGNLILNYHEGSVSNYTTELRGKGLFLNGKKYFRVENDYCQ